MLEIETRRGQGEGEARLARRGRLKGRGEGVGWVRSMREGTAGEEIEERMSGRAMVQGLEDWTDRP